MGTPDFAVPSLAALLEGGHEICGVFTQPDRPKDRGMKLQASPVKEFAIAHDLPVYQPVKMRDGTALAQIQALAPELIVVAAYGRILPEEILQAPRLGCINVHSSLLPKYRGAAPINWAILNGERETGVTIMYMAPELDAGDIIAQRATPIGPDETAPELFQRLAGLGAELLGEVVAAMEQGPAPRTPQDGAQATYAPMLGRELSPMDWTRSAQALHDQVRGLLPWPAATAELGGTQFKIFRVEDAGKTTGRAPGTVLALTKQGLEVACGQGGVALVRELQAQGGKRMAAPDYFRGHPIQID